MNNLNDEIERYLETCSNIKGLSPLTIKAYRIDLNQFINHINFKDFLSKETIVGYIDFLHKRYKPKSASRKIACIKAFYQYIETENIICDNPFHKIKVKHKPATLLPKTIPLHYIEVLLRYAYRKLSNSDSSYQAEISLRNTAVIELLFSTGMRVSEISNLKTANIDFQNQTIRILGKGNKERIIYIAGNQITSMLEKYIYTYNQDFEYAFKNRLCQRFSEQSIRNMVNDYAKKAGISLHITPHMFRHTFATSLLEEDVDIRYIQRLLGHSSITTTQIYTHISTAKIRHILEAKHPRNKLDTTLNL